MQFNHTGYHASDLHFVVLDDVRQQKDGAPVPLTTYTPYAGSWQWHDDDHDDSSWRAWDDDEFDKALTATPLLTQYCPNKPNAACQDAVVLLTVRSHLSSEGRTRYSNYVFVGLPREQ